MSSSFRQIAARPQLVLLSIMIFVQGCAYGATLPYLGVTAIGALGMSDQAYSALTVVASIMTVTISVSLGILSDGMSDRRRMIALLGIAGTIGYGAIFLFPSIPVFVIATAFVIPFAQAVHSLLFASARIQTADLSQRDAAAVNTIVRSFMSASWVVMPAILGLVLAQSANMIGAWGAAAACTLLIAAAAMLLLAPPKEGREAGGTTGAAFRDALRELVRADMLVRMIAMAAVTGTTRLAATIWPLILTLELGGSTRDVGFIAALIAFIEIPFMLIAASLLKRFSLLVLIVASALLYGLHMVGFAFATAPWHFYALALPGAATAAALLSLPITYFQDLFPTRPGLGTAFMPINSFLGNAVSATTFATGAHFFGYSGTAWLGLALAIVGVAGLLAVDRGRLRLS
ncbi:MFS transporter [Rhizobium sp. AQ_MP]|uniref:MFS transporter n=1 Tax=Rhizobium sp. AQ_MP TaxID=2761536 RepID=UPI00163AFB88|nr:MFS transporter [Rhizobium sp. AQ_MP]MBC2773830.1 MFS transporter [Rhizobium sp. AQ_MP]